MQMGRLWLRIFRTRRPRSTHRANAHRGIGGERRESRQKGAKGRPRQGRQQCTEFRRVRLFLGRLSKSATFQREIQTSHTHEGPQRRKAQQMSGKTRTNYGNRHSYHTGSLHLSLWRYFGICSCLGWKKGQEEMYTSLGVRRRMRLKWKQSMKTEMMQDDLTQFLIVVVFRLLYLLEGIFVGKLSSCVCFSSLVAKKRFLDWKTWKSTKDPTPANDPTRANIAVAPKPSATAATERNTKEHTTTR